ncbi:MAG: SPOR domain-containing protein [Helicobacteraceae bacterium]|jgi:cell division septation protein DedD|nr:SPOR domain-containing protein [Helicobacteraceae bacterium]
MADIINSEDELNDILIKREEGAGGKVRNALLISAAMLLMAVIAFLTLRMVDADQYDDAQSSRAQTGAVNADPIGDQPKTMFESPQPTVSDPEQVRSAIDEIIARHREARNAGQNASVAQNVPSAATQPQAATPSARQPQTTTPPAVQPPGSGSVKPPQTASQTPPQSGPAVSQLQSRPVAAAQPPRATSQTPKPSSSGGLFYVQIESLAAAPRAAYLQTLRDRGLNVVVRDKIVNAKNVHRIYVGPYKTRDEALGALPALRRDYSPDAFIAREE